LPLTKIRITGFENISKTVRLKIGKAIAQGGFAKTMQTEITKEIREAGIKPELAASTVKTRRYLSRFNSTHPKFDPDKSNLTITGRLLDSLRGKFLVAKLSFTIDSLSSKHKRYKTGSNKGKSALPSLKQIFEWQKDAGRDIAQVFTRKLFVSDLAKKLKEVIIKNYRN
jgi:hypothetical protein